MFAEVKTGCIFASASEKITNCGNGGTGRRIRFRGVRPYGCGGSTPPSRTQKAQASRLGLFFCPGRRIPTQVATPLRVWGFDSPFPHTEARLERVGPFLSSGLPERVDAWRCKRHKNAGSAAVVRNWLLPFGGSWQIINFLFNNYKTNCFYVCIQ